MTVFDILGFAILGIAAVVVLLRLFRVVDWSWPATLFPLFLFFIYQIVVAVVAGIGNYMGYMRGLSGRFLGQ
ncbi:MAG: hypothetical protein AB1916_14380 [Thermodesulfobacteriota bacterium]